VVKHAGFAYACLPRAVVLVRVFPSAMGGLGIENIVAMLRALALGFVYLFWNVLRIHPLRKETADEHASPPPHLNSNSLVPKLRPL